MKVVLLIAICAIFASVIRNSDELDITRLTRSMSRHLSFILTCAHFILYYVELWLSQHSLRTACMLQWFPNSECERCTTEFRYIRHCITPLSIQHDPPWEAGSCLAARKLPAFYGTKRFLPCSQKPAVGRCRDPAESSPHTVTSSFPTLCFNSHPNTVLSSKPRSQIVEISSQKSENISF
jgi:hypothetical protein